VVLLEALINGLSALSFSAQQQEEALLAASADGNTRATDARNISGQKKQQPKARASCEATASCSESPMASGVQFTGVLVLSIALAMGLFVALPHLLTWLIGLKTDTIAFHLVDGMIKVAILVAYIGSIGLMKDIRRVYMYHGAEHKAIYAYEKGLSLSVENARAQSRFHPRCGTSFLVMVILVSVFLFALLLQHTFSNVALIDHLLKILIKIPLMFPVAGLSYEGIKLSHKFQNSPLVRALVAPGLWLQRLTTREPTDDQLEVALVALQKALWREQAPESAADTGIQQFASYAEAELALKI
jgi:uncharacterized protein YqhQ